MSIDRHIESVRRVVELLELDSVAVVGHDSGGLIARHAMVDHPRLRAMGLVNTEPPDPSWRFTSFVAAGKIPGFGAGLGWVVGRPRLRRSPFVLGDAFADRSHLEGEFDEFFLRPLHDDEVRRDAATTLLRSFRMQLVRELDAIHTRIDVPVKLVWGDRDPFFPVERARAMVHAFPDATIDVIQGAGLFSHEERPAEVAQALLPTIT